MSKRKGEKWKETWDERKSKWLEGGIQVCFLNKTVYVCHCLCRGEKRRDKSGERVYEAPGESVKNRQLHRQKRDAESICLFKVKGKKAGKHSEKGPLVLTEAINSRTVRLKTKKRNGKIRLYSQWRWRATKRSWSEKRREEINGGEAVSGL